LESRQQRRYENSKQSWQKSSGLQFSQPAAKISHWRLRLCICRKKAADSIPSGQIDIGGMFLHSRQPYLTLPAVREAPVARATLIALPAKGIVVTVALTGFLHHGTHSINMCF
jgi:hypothetical protein